MAQSGHDVRNYAQVTNGARDRSASTVYAAFLLALNFAHLARWNAAILRRAAADIVRLDRAGLVLSFAACFAHRAFCARLIFLRAAADIFLRGFV
jgi:hypothetical protein